MIIIIYRHLTFSLVLYETRCFYSRQTDIDGNTITNTNRLISVDNRFLQIKQLSKTIRTDE